MAAPGIAVITSPTTPAALHPRYLVGDVADRSTLRRVREGMRGDGLVVFDGVGDVEVMRGLAKSVMTVVGHPDSDQRGITVITDHGSVGAAPNAGGFSRHELMAHTDRSGIASPPTLLMMCCAQQAHTGGTSQFIDGLAVYEDLVNNCADAWHALSGEGSVRFGGAAGYLGAVFAPVAGSDPSRVTIRLRLDDLVEFSPAVAHWVPELTAAIARHTQSTTLQTGQGVLLDNHRWLHARDSFLGPRRVLRLLGEPTSSLGMSAGIPVGAASAST